MTYTRNDYFYPAWHFAPDFEDDFASVTTPEQARLANKILKDVFDIFEKANSKAGA